MKRRYATNCLITPEGEFLRQYMVELTDGIVTARRPLGGAEPERTEWLPGAIELVAEADGRVRAYHLSSFNFQTMTASGETPHTLLP
jgi:hypothetical protein